VGIEPAARPVELAAAPAPQVLGPTLPATRVAAVPVVPAVAEPTLKPAPQQTSSPHGRPSRAEVALPAAKPLRRSSLVAAGTTGRPARRAVRVALDLPPALEAVDVKLPVLSVGPARSSEQPVVATALDAPPPMEPRPISAFRPQRPAEVLAASVPVAPAKAAAASLANQPLAAARCPRPAEVVSDRPTPQALLVPLSGALGPGRLASPESLFQRSFEQRQKLLNEMGGSKASEAAVARALVYLARTQQPDGRWTYERGAPLRERRRGRHRVDVAVTGLALLCFLAADHTPAKDGPYRQTVEKGIEFLLARQGPDGDLRGGGQMYGHAIAALAIAEAAIMTGNERYRHAAVKAAQFIVKAQNAQTGGWRYHPGQPGDTSVFGWQVMALRSVEHLGYKIPPRTRQGAFRWLKRVGGGKRGMLAGYRGRSPTPAMTAEAVFSRILLGQELTEEEEREADAYLMAHPPGRGSRNFYYWYYASLTMMQMQTPNWPKWNARMRDLLLELQHRSGELEGSWDTNSRWGSRGGRIYTTALATLTLEVYYRYLPMYLHAQSGGGQ